MRKVRISVVIPVYNVEEYLAQCLDSIISQTYSNLEIICVNDGSTDRSQEILERYARQDDRIRVVVRSNGGLGAARNTGLAHAGGEYVCFVDSDDWLEEDTFEILLSKLTGNDVDFVLFGMKVYDNELGHFTRAFNMRYFELGVFDHFLEGKKLDIAELKEHFFDIDMNVSACNRLFKRSFLEENVLKFLEGVVYEDLFFFTDLCMRAESFLFLSTGLYCYRARRAGSLTSGDGNALDMWKSIVYVFENRENLSSGEWDVKFWKYFFEKLRQMFLTIKNQEVKEMIYDLASNFLVANCVIKEVGRKSFVVRDKVRIFQESSSADEFVKNMKPFYSKKKKKRFFFKEIQDEDIKYYLFDWCIASSDLEGRKTVCGISF